MRRRTNNNKYTPTTRQAKCKFCGKGFAYLHKTGRPREFCEADCRETDKLIQRLDRHLEGVAETMTPEQVAKLRSRIWGIANHLNRRGRPSKVRRNSKGRALLW